MPFNTLRGSPNMGTLNESDALVHDVIIIGAGPCGLAVATRLCEHTHTAIFTDEEHQRYHWIKKHNGRMSIKHKKDGSVSTPQQPRPRPQVLHSRPRRNGRQMGDEMERAVQDH